jgi:dihydroorotate dehydrogenase (fumarate)
LLLQVCINTFQRKLRFINLYLFKKSKAMADLTTKYMGLTLRNPIIIASSGLTDTFSKIADLERNGAGAIVMNSLFEEQIILEAEQNFKEARKNNLIYAESSETLDYIDLHISEKELGKYLDIIKQVKKNLSIPLIASVNCVSDIGWTGFAKQIEKAGADALELNIFIMPFGFDNNCDETEQKYYKILRKVKQEINIPVAVKISPYSTNLGKVIMNLENEGANGVVLFNRFASPDIDIENIKVITAEVFSNPAEMNNSLRWVAILANRLKIDIAASSGVHDGKAMIKQILAGACAVQIASSLYKNGISYITEMLKYLESWMDKKGFNYIDQFKGKLSQEKHSHPDVYERLQFMKYFGDIK